MSDSASPTEPRLLCSIEGGVATVTINVPERLNAFDDGPGSLHRELAETLERLDEDDSVRCSVITGAGRAFSSGGDQGTGKKLETATDIYWFHVDGGDDNERIRNVRKPTIAAINGMCYGAGLMMAVHFDMLIATESAKLGLIETRFGGTGANVLAYHVGPQWAKFLALSGELITATKACEIGLVLAVFPDDEFQAKVGDLARRVAAMPFQAVEMNKMVVNSAIEHMGWKEQTNFAIALNSIATEEIPRARAANGKTFKELGEEGWAAWKAGRDEAFKEPWLDR